MCGRDRDKVVGTILTIRAERRAAPARATFTIEMCQNVFLGENSLYVRCTSVYMYLFGYIYHLASVL